jgi:CelD/BcsL family acetyltransferase involved in cellulose biosynthesis
MELTLVNSIEEWKGLEEAWDELVSRSVRPYPFLEFWYLYNWWQTLGGGEWLSSESQLCIVTGFERGKLKGIAPLFVSSKEGSPPALRFIGQIEVTDYLDFIAAEEDLPAFLTALLDFLDENEAIPVKNLELANLLDDSPSLRILEQAAEQRQRRFKQTVLQPAPAITLTDSWDEYLQSLNKKQRHEVRRKLRNAERDFQIELYLVENAAEVIDEIRIFVELMRNEEEKKQFLSGETEQYLLSLGKAAFEKNRFNLAFLLLDGQKVAGYLNFIAQNRLWVYNTGWNPDFSKYSPGWLLLSKLIQWSIDQGLQEVDLMRGAEDYKYRFGGIDRHVVAVQCS